MQRFFRFDRKLLGELPGCAWRALRLYFAAWFGGEEVVPGAIGFLQTSGELLGWHPHLPMLLTDGGWLPGGTFRHLLGFDASAVEKLFRAAVPPVVLGVAFLVDFASLHRLLAHLGCAPQQPEPLAHSPPVESKLYISNA